MSHVLKCTSFCQENFFFSKRKYTLRKFHHFIFEKGSKSTTIGNTWIFYIDKFMIKTYTFNTSSLKVSLPKSFARFTLVSDLTI